MIFGSDSKHKRKAKSNSWNYSRGQQNKTERNEIKQEKIYAIHIFCKGLISKLYKEFIQLKSKQKKPTSFQKGPKVLIDIFFQRRYTDDKQAQGKML